MQSRIRTLNGDQPTSAGFHFLTQAYEIIEQEIREAAVRAAGCRHYLRTGTVAGFSHELDADMLEGVPELGPALQVPVPRSVLIAAGDS